MKQKYVPLEKRTKKMQKQFHDKQRNTWGELNPLTRKTANQKIYNRKKSERWHEYEPGSDFLVGIGISCVDDMMRSEYNVMPVSK